MKDLTDDDLLSAVGTDNAIERSKDDDDEEQERLKKNVQRIAKRDLEPSEEDQEFERLVALIRRSAGLTEAHTTRYEALITAGGESFWTSVIAEDSLRAARILRSIYGQSNPRSRPRRV